MKCTNCGNKEFRKVTTEQFYYLQCKSCEKIIMETPAHIPNEQKQRYLKRIQKGK